MKQLFPFINFLLKDEQLLTLKLGVLTVNHAPTAAIAGWLPFDCLLTLSLAPFFGGGKL